MHIMNEDKRVPSVAAQYDTALTADCLTGKLNF
jgi:hypothetical protein